MPSINRLLTAALFVSTIGMSSTSLAQDAAQQQIAFELQQGIAAQGNAAVQHIQMQSRQSLSELTISLEPSSTVTAQPALLAQQLPKDS